MAACGFGTSGLKTNLDLGSDRPKLSTLQPLHGLRTQKIVRFDGLVLSHRSNKIIIECRSSNSEADSTATTNLEDNFKETVSSDALSTLVESLLTVLCDTSIAEFELKRGEFRLHVTRELAEQSAPPQLPFPAPVTAHSVVETPGSNGSASSTSLALTKPVPSSGGVQTLLDKAADEGLMILQSPRVGYFRRSRTIKGKRAPPSCKEVVFICKFFMFICYIFKLYLIISDIYPIGYGDALIAVLPSFPGI
ncbi:hypothetical protein Pfo_020048 [Paulownia fortunei]|nr:hypothetical protein Pfo_020048 [Paulownia fortunei]